MSKKLSDEDKKDLRIIKSKRAICNAVCKLLTEKEINAIKVSEVAELACVNRKTFYNYYSNVHNVVDEIACGIASGLSDLLESMDPGELMKNPSLFFRELKKAAAPNYEILEYLLKMQGNQALVTHIIEILQTRLTETVHSMVKKEESDRLPVIMDFLICGMIYSYREWVISGKPSSLEMFSDTIGQLAVNGLNSFI